MTTPDPLSAPGIRPVGRQLAPYSLGYPNRWGVFKLGSIQGVYWDVPKKDGMLRTSDGFSRQLVSPFERGLHNGLRVVRNAD